MAEVTVSEVTVVKEVAEKRYNVSLSEREAAALAVVLCKIGGSEESSPRGYTSRIHYALRTAGVKYEDQIEYSLMGYDSSFYYQKYKQDKFYPSNNRETFSK